MVSEEARLESRFVEESCGCGTEAHSTMNREHGVGEGCSLGESTGSVQELAKEDWAVRTPARVCAAARELS